MTVNKYFNFLTNTKEQDFFESFVVESIKMTGMDIYFFPRNCQIDPVLRDPYKSEFKNYYVIEAYFHNIEGFGGENDVMTKFGFQQMDTVEVSIAKKSWRDLKIPGREDRPLEGDVIFLPFSKSFFQIGRVEHEIPFWQLGRYNVFRLMCNLYTAGYNEIFGTDNDFFNVGANADNVYELKHQNAINDAVQSKGEVLLDFDEKNPFSNI